MFNIPSDKMSYTKYFQKAAYKNQEYFQKAAYKNQEKEKNFATQTSTGCFYTLEI